MLTLPSAARAWATGLQTHYRHLEALALNRDAPEATVDLTEPNTEQITRLTRARVERFVGLTYPEGYVPGEVVTPAAAAKRKAAAAADGGDEADRPAPKRAKVAAGDVDVADVRRHYDAGTVRAPACFLFFLRS